MAFSLTCASAPVIAVVDGIPTTTSVDVARHFGKRHDDVLKAIRNLLPQLPDGGVRNFAETPYTEQQNGQTYPAYRITRDGFTLLAMGFTGKRALAFKLAYIDAFNRMESALRAPAAQASAARDQQLAALELANALSSRMQRQVFERVASSAQPHPMQSLPAVVQPLFAMAVARLCADAHEHISAWAAGKLAYGCNLNHSDRLEQRAIAMLAELHFDDWLSQGETARARALVTLFEVAGQMAAESSARIHKRLANPPTDRTGDARTERLDIDSVKESSHG